MLDAGVFLRLFVGVITGADQSAAFHDAEADAQAEVFPVEKFFRRSPARNRQVLRGRLEILADGEDVGLVGGDVADRLFNFVLLFADAEHNAGLGDEAAALRVAEDGAGAVVAGLHADGFLQAFDGLEVVVVDVGLGVEDDIDVLQVAFEIGHQNFDRGSGAAVLDGTDGHRPDGGATVGEFIAGDTGDDAVFEIHLRHGVGDAGGFAEVELRGAASLDRAEIAGARADVAEDHHGGGPAGPAFAEIGALGALADGVEFVFVDEFARGEVAGAGRKLGTEPGRFARGVHQRGVSWKQS